MSFYFLPPFAVILDRLPAHCAGAQHSRSRPPPLSLSPSNRQPPLQPALSPIFTREVQHWAKTSSAGQTLPPSTRTWSPSSCRSNPAAIRVPSRAAGAMGLFQVMPFHFHFGENPIRPRDQRPARTQLPRAFTRNRKRRCAPRAGWLQRRHRRHRRGEWTWSCRDKAICPLWRADLRDARSGASSSATLDEWYRKYGAGLCRQAASRLGLSP